jgi:tetratricopeptide (TPR) repeat protein
VDQELDADDLLIHILSLDDEMQWNKSLFKGGLYVLQSFSFIKSAATAGTYTMHQLVHGWTQDQMVKGQPVTTVKALNVLFKSSITFGDSLEEITFFRQLVPHMAAYQRSIEVIIPEWREADLQLLHRLGYVYWKMCNWQWAMRLWQKEANMSKRMLGSEHVDTLTSMDNLALTYQDLGEYQKAEGLHLQVLEARKRVLGPEHGHTLISMNNLAKTYHDLGEYQKAEGLHLQVLEARKRVLGPEHVATLTSMNNLAGAYQHLGEYQKAEGLHLQVLERWKRVLGPEHVLTLTSMNNLASI